MCVWLCSCVHECLRLLHLETGAAHGAVPAARAEHLPVPAHSLPAPTPTLYPRPRLTNPHTDSMKCRWSAVSRTERYKKRLAAEGEDTSAVGGCWQG